ncbi:fumarylacetoacetate hydrolase [Yamadazyma tenuis]|uniref:Fumarylacetoacetate hydralase n=1 Tax=Candida tenuis (strain ATCC 10573 / BCRC 21748 / CBS 615 / JCM 9827 / NBRC 10315 / NRRL Y-1498 / VKM Y-70) TaxID=590646 RepID=G3B7N4_CANTC|nr:fumarylacetoacetate hydrolase [Yamadazyma tenuis ATCC 10573]EGV61656.1 fumarylacetoacetate hydrolase [Yamadazyma tenuis ATCC 10573]WEJ92885.1 fumarylacetoacetate hydrolase [Yamadazyma tenuis]
MSLKYLDNARKILCIGRNYAAHISELNNAKPQQPFFFLKPSSAILRPGEGALLIPRGTVAHYEVELAFTLNRDLKNLSPDFSAEEALESIDGYAVAIDMTARNVQDEAKKKGLPWSIGKGFDTFLPMSNFIPKSKIPDPYNVTLSLSVDGVTKQHDKTDLMLFPIHKILSHMSTIMTLQKGDLILTGTPKGVGPINPGSVMKAELSYGGEVLETIEVAAEEKPGPYQYKEI